MNMTDEARRVADKLARLDCTHGDASEGSRLLRTLAAEVERLEAETARLPRTADGVLVGHDFQVWQPGRRSPWLCKVRLYDPDDINTQGGHSFVSPAFCYSTRSAAIEVELAALAAR